MANYEDIIIKEGKMMCDLCKVLFPDDDIKLIKYHLNGKNHMGLYQQRIKVQNNIVAHPNSEFCRLCDENVIDLTFHLESVNHREIMRLINNIVEKDGAFLLLPRDECEEITVHCLICDCATEFTLDSIKKHINDQTHLKARAIAVQPFNGIFSVEGSNDDLWCKICRVYFQNYIELIFEHVDENKEHNVKLSKILRLIEGENISIEEYLTNPTEDKATCHKCNTGVACNVDNLERHIKGKQHKHS